MFPKHCCSIGDSETLKCSHTMQVCHVTSCDVFGSFC